MKNIAVTGMTGTGSSAVIDLLKEFEDVGVSKNITYSYEHVIFYANNGIFDLGNALLSNNTIFKCDSKVAEFKSSMSLLYKNDFVWFGGYKKIIGKEFEVMVNNFLNELATEFDGLSYNKYKRVRFSLLKAIAQVILKLFSKRKFSAYGKKYIFEKRNMYFCMPNDQEFYVAAKKFTSTYLNLMKSQKKITLFDHLLLPQQSNLIKNYFDNSLKLIIVDRDPRDLYILNKYFWYKSNYGGSGKPVFPLEPNEFVNYWKKVNSYKVDSMNTLVIKFEDLIYDYENVIKKICLFANIEINQHVNQKKYFNPDRSIKNTQTYRIKDEWKKEVEIIEEKLEEYIYDFPYENKTSIIEFFDS